MNRTARTALGFLATVAVVLMIVESVIGGFEHGGSTTLNIVRVQPEGAVVLLLGALATALAYPYLPGGMSGR